MHPRATPFSTNPKRNKTYSLFFSSCKKEKKTVHDLIQLGYQLMCKAKIHHHFFDDCSLLSTARTLTYFALPDRKDTDAVTEKETMTVIALFEKRISERIPVEQITNEAFYLGRKFYVNEHVLVPRSIMNTRFTDFLNIVHWDNYRVLDLCTGSGCIGITLALLHPNITVDLSDISSKALDVAQINIANHNLQNRVQCIQGNLFENIDHKYDLIITNPPYVSARDYQKCPEEFKNEPRIALESGKDGLDLLHVILTQAKNHLTPNGLLIAEVGFASAKLLKKKYPKTPFQWFKYRNPAGKEFFFGMHGTFLCKKNDLPEAMVNA